MPTNSARQRAEALEAEGTEGTELLAEAERVISAAEQSGSRQTAEEHAALARALDRVEAIDRDGKGVRRTRSPGSTPPRGPLLAGQRPSAEGLKSTLCCPSSSPRQRQQCSGAGHSRPQRELTVSATFRSSRRQRDRDADDRSQGRADVARPHVRGEVVSRAPTQSMPWPLGIEDESNVCCPRRRTHAPDPFQPFALPESGRSTLRLTGARTDAGEPQRQSHTDHASTRSPRSACWGAMPHRTPSPQQSLLAQRP